MLISVDSIYKNLSTRISLFKVQAVSWGVPQFPSNSSSESCQNVAKCMLIYLNIPFLCCNML